MAKKPSIRLFSFAAILVVIMPIILIIGVLLWYTNALKPVSTDTTKRGFEITAGESGTQIADALKSAGLIRSTLAFRIYTKKQGNSAKLAEGVYYLSPSMDAAEITQQILHGEADVKITTIEGWRDEEIATKLQQSMGIDPKDFLAVATEGYMFPDTYLFNKKESATDIASTMNDNFYKKVTGNVDKQTIILASIVEREAHDSVPDERQTIASILLKRLKLGMPLQVDASVQYALGYDAATKKWWRELSVDDLQTPSPYNTYLHTGLPPGPICNPGLASIEAVQNASSNTPYLYYLHDSTGLVHFEKTLDEHNADKAKYL